MTGFRRARSFEQRPRIAGVREEVLRSPDKALGRCPRCARAAPELASAALENSPVWHRKSLRRRRETSAAALHILWRGTGKSLPPPYKFSGAGPGTSGRRPGNDRAPSGKIPGAVRETTERPLLNRGRGRRSRHVADESTIEP